MNVRGQLKAYFAAGRKKLTRLPSETTHIRLINHSALDMLCSGQALQHHVQIVHGVVRLTSVLINQGLCVEHKHLIQPALDVLASVRTRYQESGSYLVTRDEADALSLCMQAHDKQLAISTVSELERALDFAELTS